MVWDHARPRPMLVIVSWFISHDGRVECLDDGPPLPWWMESVEDDEDQADEECADEDQ